MFFCDKTLYETKLGVAFDSSQISMQIHMKLSKQHIAITPLILCWFLYTIINIYIYILLIQNKTTIHVLQPLSTDSILPDTHVMAELYLNSMKTTTSDGINRVLLAAES